MRGWHATRAKVVRGGNNGFAKDMKPHAVHPDARREGIAGTADRLSECIATTSRANRRVSRLCKHLQVSAGY